MSAREKILKAADELFGEVGFDAATTREIARRSGVNKALIHYHFETKEALLSHVLDRYYGRLSETLNESIGAGDTVRERIVRMVDGYMDFLDANRNFSRIVQREASGGGNLERIRRHMKPLFEIGKRLLVETYPATRSGELAAEQLLITFYGMIVGYFSYDAVLEYLLQTDPLSPKNLAARKRHIVRVIDLVITAVELEAKQAGKAVKKKPKGRKNAAKR